MPVTQEDIDAQMRRVVPLYEEVNRKWHEAFHEHEQEVISNTQLRRLVLPFSTAFLVVFGVGILAFPPSGFHFWGVVMSASFGGLFWFGLHKHTFYREARTEKRKQKAFEECQLAEPFFRCPYCHTTNISLATVWVCPYCSHNNVSRWWENCQNEKCKRTSAAILCPNPRHCPPIKLNPEAYEASKKASWFPSLGGKPRAEVAPSELDELGLEEEEDGRQS